MRGTRWVSAPCTSSWMRTPASVAACAHSRIERPICSSVFSSGTSLGRPFGRTFTLGQPRSFASCTHCLVSSMFFRTTAGSGEWYSQVVPSPAIFTAEPSNCLRTSARCAAVSDGSTPWACVVRNSTPSSPAAVKFLMIVGTSQSLAML